MRRVESLLAPTFAEPLTVFDCGSLGPIGSVLVCLVVSASSGKLMSIVPLPQPAEPWVRAPLREQFRERCRAVPWVGAEAAVEYLDSLWGAVSRSSSAPAWAWQHEALLEEVEQSVLRRYRQTFRAMAAAGAAMEQVAVAAAAADEAVAAGDAADATASACTANFCELALDLWALSESWKRRMAARVAADEQDRWRQQQQRGHAAARRPLWENKKPVSEKFNCLLIRPSFLLRRLAANRRGALQALRPGGSGEEAAAAAAASDAAAGAGAAGRAGEVSDEASKVELGLLRDRLRNRRQRRGRRGSDTARATTIRHLRPSTAGAAGSAALALRSSRQRRRPQSAIASTRPSSLMLNASELTAAEADEAAAVEAAQAAAAAAVAEAASKRVRLGRLGRATGTVPSPYLQRVRRKEAGKKAARAAKAANAARARAAAAAIYGPASELSPLQRSMAAEAAAAAYTGVGGVGSLTEEQKRLLLAVDGEGGAVTGAEYADGLAGTDEHYWRPRSAHVRSRGLTQLLDRTPTLELRADGTVKHKVFGQSEGDYRGKLGGFKSDRLMTMLLSSPEGKLAMKQQRARRKSRLY